MNLSSNQANRTFTVDQLQVNVFINRQQLGQQAAQAVASQIRYVTSITGLRQYHFRVSPFTKRIFDRLDAGDQFGLEPSPGVSYG